MKKHLVAFLSMIGLAGSAPVQAQVLKGSDQPTRKESQIKQNKQTQENNAQKIVDKSAKNTAEQNAANAQIQDKRKDKWAKVDAENKAVKLDAQDKSSKNATFIKYNKNTAESKAANNQSKIKLNQATVRNQSQGATTGQKNALTKAQLTKGKDAQPK
jgi:hypothetical protein